MKGEFVDINQEGARVEVSTNRSSSAPPAGEPATKVSFPYPFEVDEPTWRKLVEEIDGMIGRTKR